MVITSNFYSYHYGYFNGLCLRYGNYAIYLYLILNMEIQKEENYKIFTVFTLISLVLYLLNKNAFFFFLGILLLIISIFFPHYADLIARVWKKITFLISRLYTVIFLFLLFFLFLKPISLIYRLFNFKKVAFFFQDNRVSYFDDLYIPFSEKSFISQG